MNRIEIEGHPIAWKRAGHAHGRFYDRQIKEKESIRAILTNIFPNPPLDKAISINATFTFCMPKSWSIKKKMELDGTPHDLVPDIDNLLKFFFDAGKGILWTDDRRIASLAEVHKIWGKKDSTIIEFKEYEKSSSLF